MTFVVGDPRQLIDAVPSDDLLGDVVLTESELEELALAADPDTPLTADATPWQPERDQSLPTSYLPQPSVRSRPPSTVRTVTVLVVIAAFLAITALGFCATYGQLLPA